MKYVLHVLKSIFIEIRVYPIFSIGVIVLFYDTTVLSLITFSSTVLILLFFVCLIIFYISNINDHIQRINKRIMMFQYPLLLLKLNYL